MNLRGFDFILKDLEAFPLIRENFSRLKRLLTQQTLLKGEFKFLEITFTQAVTNFQYPHKLGFVPKDVIQTSLIGANLTWNYDLFTREFLDITTTGPCVVRAYIGTYSEVA